MQAAAYARDISGWFSLFSTARRTRKRRRSMRGAFEMIRYVGWLWNATRRLIPSGLPSEGWRRGRDSNPWKPFGFNGFQDRRLKPLGHLSAGSLSRDFLRAVHVRPQRGRNRHRPVFLLVVFEDRD